MPLLVHDDEQPVYGEGNQEIRDEELRIYGDCQLAIFLSQKDTSW